MPEGIRKGHLGYYVRTHVELDARYLGVMYSVGICIYAYLLCTIHISVFCNACKHRDVLTRLSGRFAQLEVEM